MIWKILFVVSALLNLGLLYGNILLRRCVDKMSVLAADSFIEVINQFKATHQVLESQIGEYERFKEECHIFWPGLAKWAAKSMADNLKVADKYRAIFRGDK